LAENRRALAWPARAFLLAALLGLGACSINPRLALPAGEPVFLGGVPFHPQTEYQCGPAALAGLLGASGVAITPEQLEKQVYLPKRQGSLQLELLGATRRAGRIPYIIDREPAAVLAELEAGRPVLVLQNVLTPSVPRWHYAVVVGSDPARNRFILNTGVHKAKATRARSFLRTWDWADRWGIVTLRPGEIPVGATPLRYAEAVAAFEPVGGAAAARVAWEAARRHWPDDHRAWLALGNLDYAAGDRKAALASFVGGLARSPREPVLSNNYASVLAEAGCRARARTVLDDALDVLPPDSPWLAALTSSRADLPADAADAPGCDAD
jgi:tetratricopeptide (TPR) repeat protein